MPTIHHWSQTHLPVDQSTDSTSTSGAAGDPAQQPWSPAPEGRYEYARRTEAMQEIVKSEVRSRCTLFLMLFFMFSRCIARKLGREHTDKIMPLKHIVSKCLVKTKANLPCPSPALSGTAEKKLGRCSHGTGGLVGHGPRTQRASSLTPPRAAATTRSSHPLPPKGHRQRAARPAEARRSTRRVFDEVPELKLTS